jgi:cytochrome c peroxidase
MTHRSATSWARGHAAALAGAILASATLLACAEPKDLQELSQSSVGEMQQQIHSLPFDLRALSTEPVPQPFVIEDVQPTVGTIINQAAAIRLGKAFFWDIQAGSDGQVACAVCHASFGTDARRFNTLYPGLDGVFASGGVTGPGQLFTPSLVTNDDVVGVQGVARGQFVSFNPDPHIAKEDCTPITTTVFADQRQVEFRQAPMIYGAVFLRQLFWAGEASDEFNGTTIWGFRGNNLGPTFIHLGNAALASQAVGPPSNNTEMRCVGRLLLGPTGLAGKMMARQPLQFQRVSPRDSVLGALANPSGPGLICNGVPCTYGQMIAEAFDANTTAGVLRDTPNRGTFTVIWGLAIQAYEQTLIPDRTPFDRFFSGHLGALTPRQLLGLATFVGRGNCATCHAGPMLSDATTSFFHAHGALNRDGGDQGFHNIGLLDSFDDGGRGDFGPGGVPFTVSFSDFDNFAFKTPTLRNVGLTAPYFHSGVKPTLEDVVDFYDRGGDFPNPEKSADIKPLHLTSFEKAALVDFMRNGLTDCRVLKQRAPFDHPELPVPNGTNLAAVGRDGIGPCSGDGDGDDDDDDHGHGHGHDD